MQIDFNQVITDFDGKPQERPVLDKYGKAIPTKFSATGEIEEVEFEDVTLKNLAIEALQLGGKDDEKITFSEKQKRNRLAERIHNAEKAITVSIAETKMLIDLLGERYRTAIAVPACDLLDPPTDTDKKEEV